MWWTLAQNGVDGNQLPWDSVDYVVFGELMLFHRNLSGLATLVVALAVLACGSAAEGGAGIGGEVMEPASSYGGDVDMVYLWGGGCSQNLKSQLKYQVSLDTVDELNGLIKAVQKRVPGCEVEVWNPRVWDVGPDAIDGTCSDRGSVDDTLWRVMDSYSDDGTRRWLMRDPSGEDRAAGVRLESGRGPGGVLLLHFTDGSEGSFMPPAAERAADGEPLCWVMFAGGHWQPGWKSGSHSWR